MEIITDWREATEGKIRGGLKLKKFLKSKDLDFFTKATSSKEG